MAAGKDDFDNPSPADDDSEEEEESEEYLTSMLNKLSNKAKIERIPLRVHEVIIQGNSKTKESVIKAEIIDYFENAESFQEICLGVVLANYRLRELGVFDEVWVRLDGGPTELTGTAIVVVEVVESKTPLTAQFGCFTRPGARSWSLEGGLKLKNLFGYADIWDGSVSYGWDHTTEASVGVALPKIRNWAPPMFARASLLSQDWQSFSYKEQALGVGIGLLSITNHDLKYNIGWRILTDPSQMAGPSVRRQLGHNLLSSVNYTYKVDKRNSMSRPTRGYAFSSSTVLAGIVSEERSPRFVRQKLDLRYAFPLGFSHSALNLGISAGLIFPWGKGFLEKPSSLPDRFFMGGKSSPVCSLSGPKSLPGFKSRGLGPTEPRRQTSDQPDVHPSPSSERDALGGDLAVSAFADLSFDLPSNFLKQLGIHSHVFAATGNLAKLTEDEWRNFSAKGFLESFRSTVGCGIVVPTKLFRMEVNYCHIVRQFEHDRGRTGLQLSFSTP